MDEAQELIEAIDRLHAALERAGMTNHTFEIHLCEQDYHSVMEAMTRSPSLAINGYRPLPHDRTKRTAASIHGTTLRVEAQAAASEKGNG